MNSVTSCSINLKPRLPPKCEMLSTAPVTKLSMPTTLCPRANNRSTRCEPRKPAAPVTTEVGPDEERCFAFLLIGCSGMRVGVTCQQGPSPPHFAPVDLL